MRPEKMSGVGEHALANSGTIASESGRALLYGGYYVAGGNS